jgi:hypothetical protein
MKNKTLAASTIATLIMLALTLPICFAQESTSSPSPTPEPTTTPAPELFNCTLNASIGALYINLNITNYQDAVVNVTAFPYIFQYAENDTLSFTAYPQANYNFTCWSINSTSTVLVNPYTANHTGNLTVTAQFTVAPQTTTSPTPSPAANDTATPTQMPTIDGTATSTPVNQTETPTNTTTTPTPLFFTSVPEIPVTYVLFPCLAASAAIIGAYKIAKTRKHPK